MSRLNFWYLKQNGKTTGPFPVGQIQEYILLKKIHPEDLVSQDKESWCKVVSVSELIPDVLKQKRDENYQERLKSARRWAEAENLELTGTDSLHRGQRHGTTHVPIKTIGWKTFSLTFMMISIVIFGAFYLMPKESMTRVDCHIAPQAGLNFDGCKFPGTNLAGRNLEKISFTNAELEHANFRASHLNQANFSYAKLSSADFTRAKLKQSDFTGADLTGARLTGADLTGANLSYANLMGVKSKNIRLEGAILDKATWFNGKLCAKGSIGKCLTKK